MVTVSGNPNPTNPTNPTYPTNPTNPTNPTTKYRCEFGTREFGTLFCIYAENPLFHAMAADMVRCSSMQSDVVRCGI